MRSGASQGSASAAPGGGWKIEDRGRKGFGANSAEPMKCVTSLRSPTEDENGNVSLYAAFTQVATLEYFNRGSSPKCSGFPLKACGNDGPRERHARTPNRIFEGDLFKRENLKSPLAREV